MLECYSEVVKKARKEHKCECCDLIIPKGKLYSHASGKYDGEFFTRKLHARCQEVLNKYISEESPYGEFHWDWVHEWINDNDIKLDESEDKK